MTAGTTMLAMSGSLRQRGGQMAVSSAPMARWLARPQVGPAVGRMQQRGARATPPMRRYTQQQQQLQQVAAIRSLGKTLVRKPVALLSAGRMRAGNMVRSKKVAAKEKYEKPAKEKSRSQSEASERTHAADSRLGLSKNALMLRFSNENSYLNWARNGVLSSGVGVAMYAQEHHRGAQLSGAGLLLLGFGYIGVGTAKYIYYILRFRQVMELSWTSVVGTSSHASAALLIWLTATASFLESVPLELDAMLLTEPIIDFLPFRIRQGLIETYSLYLDDLEHHTDEQERVLRAIRGERTYSSSKIPASIPEMVTPLPVPVLTNPDVPASYPTRDD